MALQVENLGGKTMHIGQDCAHCNAETRCRRRDFSEQAWSVLLVWGEIEKSAVDQPICEDCYRDLREILIDRADEIDVALAQPSKAETKRGKKKAATAKKTTRKAKGKRTTKVA